MSLPGGSTSENHSTSSETSGNCFNVSQATYDTQHTAQHEDATICKHIEVPEVKLVHLIRKNKAPLVRSTMDSDGNISIAITKMSMHVDYTAISHV